MGMTFGQAIDEETKWGKTWNGADALVRTGSACVDMLGRIGAMRANRVEDKLQLFEAAWNENPLYALRLLFYTRDVRGGYGERDTFKQVLHYLANKEPEVVAKNLWAILEFGRASDLYALIGTKAEDSMWQFMKEQFELDLANMDAGKSISLLAKWIASPDSSVEATKALGIKTAKKFGYNFKHMREYRKKLRALRKYIDIPEAKMCAGKWNEIEYSKCGSKFLAKKSAACKRHDEERFNAYFESVKSGEAKINTATLTPVDVLIKALRGEVEEADVLWANLKNVCEHNALVMCDTSGSMTSNYGISVKPIDVAVAMSIYFAERNVGDLKNKFLTFCSSPEFVEIKGTNLIEKYRSIVNARWGSSTNLEAAFDLVLDTATKHHIANEDMPKCIVIISDMQIDRCVYSVEDNKLTFYDQMSKRFEEAGYIMPHVVFWNVNAMNATFHASMSDNGVGLVSGYSANVFKSVMENIGRTPYDLMVSIVESDRYKNITI